MRLSRSKLELFIECPRCFYKDFVLKVYRPSSFPLNLNNAVDTLMKREFDNYRFQGKPHPAHTGDAIGFLAARHDMLNTWRSLQMGGLSYYNKEHDCTYFGLIDDLWVNSSAQFAVVDYKSTAKSSPVVEVPHWAAVYKRQISFYSFLLMKNGVDVCNMGFLLYATALTSESEFDNHMKFSTNSIRVDIDYAWIYPTLEELHDLLSKGKIPDGSESCKYCSFVERSNSVGKN